MRQRFWCGLCKKQISGLPSVTLFLPHGTPRAVSVCVLCAATGDAHVRCYAYFGVERVLASIRRKHFERTDGMVEIEDQIPPVAVPGDVGEWVLRQAKHAGKTPSEWVADLILREREESR